MDETVMVIGYGNDLRSDDGIGTRIANAIAAENLPKVKSFAVHQLTPELAAMLANVDLVIFVDAGLSVVSSQVQVQPLSPSASSLIHGHMGDGRSLLALTQAMYGHYPRAWLVTVPGINFEVGESLSPMAEAGMAIAHTKIIQLLSNSSTLMDETRA
jgi:hydrogenase maturation protease